MQPTDFENLTRQAKLHLAEIERLTLLQARTQAWLDDFQGSTATARVAALAADNRAKELETKLTALIEASERACDRMSSEWSTLSPEIAALRAAVAEAKSEVKP